MGKKVLYGKSLGELLFERFSSHIPLFLQKLFINCFPLVFFLRKILLLPQLKLYSELVRSDAKKRTHSAYIWEVLNPLEGLPLKNYHTFQKNSCNQLRVMHMDTFTNGQKASKKCV